MTARGQRKELRQFRRHGPRQKIDVEIEEAWVVEALHERHLLQARRARLFCFRGSAMSRWRASVAPVRGGTYFLCRGKEK
jgi:hypothetical protein